jgi:phosphoribosylaminoimidazole-succinocarboxamide synthase
MNLIYQGSVKNIYVSKQDPEILIFDFTDDYSVFDWGKMPDSIPGKGATLATISGYFFKRLQDPKEWKNFFDQHTEWIRSAHPLQKAIAQELIDLGLKTHFKSQLSPTQIAVARVHVHPPSTQILANGSEFFEYRMGELNRSGELIPLEVVFRHELTSQSSALSRYPEKNLKPGQVFESPFLEFFTKLEPTDRFLTLTEVPVVGRISDIQFEELLVHTHWVSLILKTWFAEKNIKLIDGKLEWALNNEGKLMLVDAIGPDELRLEYQGQVMSKEALRNFYRETAWYQEILESKRKAQSLGQSQWQKFVKNTPPPLPKELLNSASKMYLKLEALMLDGSVP